MKSEKWEEEFEFKFNSGDRAILFWEMIENDPVTRPGSDEVKSFIKDLIASERKQAQIEILQELNGTHENEWDLVDKVRNKIKELEEKP